MDGFRPDYLDRNITPNINYLGEKTLSFIARKTEKICRKGSLQAGRQTDRQTDRGTEGQKDEQTGRPADGRTDRQTDRQTNGQTDRWAASARAKGQTDR